MIKTRDKIPLLGRAWAAPAALALLLAAAAFPRRTAAARLVLVPLSSESHISAFTALSTELETQGSYEIVMVRRQSHRRGALRVRCRRLAAPPRQTSAQHAPRRTPPSPRLRRRQVVSKEMLDGARAAADARSPGNRHTYITYPLRFDLFADDMARIAKAGSRLP
jgi:hypothetical protein